MDALDFIWKGLTDVLDIVATTWERVLGLASGVLNVSGIQNFFDTIFNYFYFFIDAVIASTAISLIIIEFYAINSMITCQGNGIDKFKEFVNANFQCFRAYFLFAMFLIKIVLFPLEILLGFIRTIV